MIGTDRSSQAINPNVHKIENPTTNNGKKVPVQLLKLKIRSKIIKPNAIGVKVLISLFTLSIDSADEIIELATYISSGPSKLSII